MCLFAERSGDLPHTDRRTQAVDIAGLMSHDDQFVTGIQQFLKRLSLDPRLDPGILFLSRSLSAEIRDIVPVLDHSLITAAAERQIDRRASGFIIRLIILAAAADADA